MAELQRSIRRESMQKRRGFSRGVKKAGLFVQRESQRIVPVRFGILRNSAFTRSEGTGSSTKVIVGYTASYAIYVHENLNARHKPGKRAKFLEAILREQPDRILEIIRRETE